MTEIMDIVECALARAGLDIAESRRQLSAGPRCREGYIFSTGNF